MNGAPLCIALTIASLAPWAFAQEVWMASGEAVAGKVAAVTGSHAKVQAADGRMLAMDVRTIDRERAADGTFRYCPATLVAGAVSARTQPLLARLQRGEVLALPDLMQMTEDCSQGLVDALGKLANGKDAAAARLAVQALAAAATKESVRVALDAALVDSTGALWREFAASISSGACVGAVQQADALAGIEKGLVSKDKLVRRGTAWVGTKLGSKAAMAVLATFVADSDHHVREAAAVCLAEAGSDSGAKVLITICKREQAPVMEANRNADAETRALLLRAVRQERVHACALLGALRHAAALPTLRALVQHRDPAIAAAAQQAITAIEAK